MNEHFITGFVKAAKAVGMTDDQITDLLKQANEPPMDEAAMAEPPMDEAAMSEAPAAEGGDQELDSLLSQLSPEEIEQLATELASEMQGEPAEDEAAQIPELAAAIEQHLGQHPEVAEATAPAPDMPEEEMAKQSAINFIKSAEYVEGFLEQALNRGMNIKQAVELYDTAFATTLNQLKTSELKGNQHKLDLNNNNKIDSEDLKKLREGKKADKEAELKGDQHKLDLNNNNKIDSEDLKKLREGKKSDVDEKTAAYYEGVLERCREYGLSDAQALEIVKSANAMETLKRGGTAITNFIKERPLTSVGGTAAAAGIAGRMSKSNKTKEEDKE